MWDVGWSESESVKHTGEATIFSLFYLFLLFYFYFYVLVFLIYDRISLCLLISMVVVEGCGGDGHG